MVQKPTYEELEKKIQKLEQTKSELAHNLEVLRESDKKYRLLTKSMEDVIVQLSPTGKLLYVSPSVKKFAGYDSDSEIGNDMSKYFANDNDRILAADLLAKIIKTPQAGNFEFLFKPKNKKPFYVEQTYFPILKNNKVTAIQLVLRDITKSKNSEAALKKASREWTMAMDAFDDVIYLLDNDRCLVKANSAFYKFMGTAPDKAIGKHIVEIAHPDGEEKPCPICMPQKKKHNFVIIMEPDDLNNPSGKPLEITAKIVKDEKKIPAGILMNLHDLTNARATEQKRAENVLMQEMKLRNTLIEALPYPTMLIQKDRTVVFANKAARDVGAIIGGTCWQDFGHCDYISNNDKEYIKTNKTTNGLCSHCTFCLADEALAGSKTLINPEVKAFGKIFETYWVPVSKVLYLHYSFDVTEKKQTEKQLSSSLDEKVVLLREIHHRVKNNMQVIVSLLRIHSRRIKDTNLRNIFAECRDRVNAMSLIHESLYQSNNLARINFKDYLTKLCRNLNLAYDASGQGIALSVGECDVTLDMDQGIAIGMVTAELISNAFKHAFPLGQGGNVSINLLELDTKNVKLIIKDNGKGMSPQIDIMNSKSLGLQLAVAAVTRELGGTIEVKRESGTKFTICFKYNRK